MLSRSKASIQNCLPNLTVDLVTEVSSTNKTDVKSQGLSPPPLQWTGNLTQR